MKRIPTAQKKGLVPNAKRMDREELYKLAVKYYVGDEIPRDLKRAVEMFQRLVADEPYAPAQFHLGECYEKGHGVPKDEKRAVALYEQAARQGGFAKAIAHLGICYRKGSCGLEKDQMRASALFAQAAELGFAAAEFELGRCYEMGSGLEKDEARAVRLYQSAFEHGFVEAQGHLGWCYEDGRGIGKDEKKAFDLYQWAVDKHGFPEAQYNLARCYKNGIGVAKDEKKAAELYRLAADQGIAEADLQLGMYYATGCGLPKDEKKAFAAYRRAADRGLPSAQCNLGYCYEKGIGVKKDEKRATDLYRQAADQGLAQAQFNLGSCYVFGIGVAKDEKLAVALYKQAADKGYTDALADLGYCYQHSIGLDKDEKKAVELYQLAANKGIEEAQCNLGYCYEKGIGVKKDEKRAVEFYQKAVEQGYGEAQFRLGCCYEKGLGELDQDKKRAVALYREAALHDSAEAHCNLGRCYAQGIGVEKNEKTAIEFFQSAVNQIKQLPKKDPRPERAFELLTEIVNIKALPEAQFELYNYYINHVLKKESNNEKAVAEIQKTAFAWCQKAADQDYLPALYELSLCYFNGQGITSDLKMGQTLLERAAERDLAEAQILLGQCYLEKRFGYEHNEALAVQWWEKAAKRGSLKAIHLLSDAYINKDPVKELECLSMGVALGDPFCLKAAATLYWEGKRGIPQDKIRAAEYIGLAAEKEDAEAQYLFSECFGSGAGVPKNDVKTLFWIKKAADNGHIKACLTLGLFSKHHGKLKESKLYLETAAKMNYAYAQYELGLLLHEEGEFENGRTWFEAAAIGGLFKAQAEIMEQHLVLYGDKQKALEYFKMMINNTSEKTEEDKVRLVNAHFSIGKMLCIEKPPLKDVKRGLEYIEIAAKGESPLALSFLGFQSLLPYDPDKSILPYDPKKAENYLNKVIKIKPPSSADLDVNKIIESAHWCLYSLYQKGAEGIEPNLEKASQHLKAMAKTTAPDLCYNLGLDHYKKGNLILARDYLTRCIKSGHKAAESILAEVQYKLKREKRLFGLQNEGELKQKEEQAKEQQDSGTKKQGFSERFSELKAFIESKNEKETYELYFRDWEIKRYDLPHYLKDLRKVTVKKTEEIRSLLTSQILLGIEYSKKIPEAVLKRVLENSFEYFNYLKTTFQKDKDQLIVGLPVLERNYTKAIEKRIALKRIDEIWNFFNAINAYLKESQDNLLSLRYQPKIEKAHTLFLGCLKDIKHVEDAFRPTLDRNSPAIHAALELDQLEFATEQFEEIKGLWLIYEKNMKDLLALKETLEEMQKNIQEHAHKKVKKGKHVVPQTMAVGAAQKKTKNPSKKQIQTEQAVLAAQKRAKDQKAKAEDLNREEARRAWAIKFEKLKQAHVEKFNAKQKAKSLQAKLDREREQRRASPPSLSALVSYPVPWAEPLTFNQRSHLNERLNFREEAKNLQELIRSCSEAREKSVISSDAKLGKEEVKIRAEVNVNQYALLGGITRLLEMSSKSSLFPIQAILARRIRNHLYHSLKSTLIQSKGEGTEFSVLLEFSAHLASFCAGYIPEKSAQLTFANLSQQLNSPILKGFIRNLLDPPKTGSFEDYLNETRSLAEDYEKFNQVNVNPTPSPAPPTPEMEKGRIRREREASYYLVSRLHANVTALDLRLRLFKSKSDPTKTGKEWIAKELVSLEFKKQAKILIEKYKENLATKAKAYRHKAPYEARRSEFQEFGSAFIVTERKERAETLMFRGPHSCMPASAASPATPGPHPNPGGNREGGRSYAEAFVSGRPGPLLPDLSEDQFPTLSKSKSKMMPAPPNT